MIGGTSIFLDPFVHRFGWVLVHFLWQGMAIALGLVFVLRLLSSASAHFRYLVIAVTLFACGLTPLVTWSVLSPAGPEYRASAIENSADGRIAEKSVPENPSAMDLQQSKKNPGEIGKDLSADWSGQSRRVISLASPYLVVLWLAGVIFLSLRLGLDWLRLQKLCHSGIPCDSIWAERFRRLVERMNICVPIQLVESVWVEVPTLIGWLRPVILLPASALSGLSTAQLEAILAHELAHVRRHDYLVNLLQTAVETLLFYHPAVWWISAKMREERENCCDDIALEVAQDRLIYVTALAALEEKRPASSLALAAGGGSLLQRIKRIVGIPKSKNSMVSGIVALLILGTVAFLLFGWLEKRNLAMQADTNLRFVNALYAVRIKKLAVENMPLNVFIGKFEALLKEADPEKKGIAFELQIPPGEDPVALTYHLDEAFEKGGANASVILADLKSRYPIRYKIEETSISIWQIPRAQLEFETRAAKTEIEIELNQTDAATALTQVREASAMKGFAFDLELGDLKSAPSITLPAGKMGVDQALRSIFYLGDLKATPLDRFRGYRVETGTVDETNARTFMETSLGACSKITPLSESQKKNLEVRIKEACDTGVRMIGHAYNPANPADHGTGKFIQEEIEISGLPGKTKASLEYVDPTIVGKTEIRVALRFQMLEPGGAFSSGAVGKWTQTSGKALMLFSMGGKKSGLPLQESKSEPYYLGHFRVTLVDEENRPLLPPREDVEGIRLWGQDTAKLWDGPETAKNPALTKELIASVTANDPGKVQALLEKGADPNAKNSSYLYGSSALTLASKNKGREMIELLLSSGADPEARDGHDESPMQVALNSGNLEAVSTLRERGAKISPAVWAAVSGDVPALETLLAQGKIQKGKTDELMKYAVLMGQIEVVKFFERLDKKPVTGKQLAWAAGAGRIAMMEYILSRGVDLKKDGGKALDYAVVLFDQPEATRFLLKRGVDPNSLSGWKKYMISHASSAAMVRVLLEAGANPNIRIDKEAPITYMTDAESVRLMLQYGATLHLNLPEGMTPLDYVMLHELEVKGGDCGALIDEFVRDGAEFDPKGNGARILVRVAAYGDRDDVVRMLLDRGVSPDAARSDSFGVRSALGEAARAPSSEILKLLLARGARPSGDPLENYSPLANALLGACYEQAELLRQAGANEVGELSFQTAKGDLARVRELLQAGADPNERDPGGQTPLNFAVRKGQPEIAALLVEKGANVSSFARDGCSPYSLYQMIKGGVEYRLTDDTSQMMWGVNLKEFQRKSALFEKLFDQHPPDPNYQDKDGRTVFHQAAWVGNSCLGPFTSERGPKADVNIRDKKGEIPLLSAVHSPMARDTTIKIHVGKGKEDPLENGTAWNATAYIVDFLIRDGAKLEERLPNGRTVREEALLAAKEAKNEQLILVLEKGAKPTVN